MVQLLRLDKLKLEGPGATLHSSTMSLKMRYKQKSPQWESQAATVDGQLDEESELRCNSTQKLCLPKDACSPNIPSFLTSRLVVIEFLLSQPPKYWITTVSHCALVIFKIICQINKLTFYLLNWQTYF